MDYLDRLIQLSRLEGEINILCRFQGEWKITHRQSPHLMGIFHIISRGECELRLDNRCYRLKTGDVFFLPSGAEHVIASGKNTDWATHIMQSSFGPFKLHTNHHDLPGDFEMFCGYFYYSRLAANTLFNLPKWHLSGKNRTVMALLELLRKEADPALLGNKLVVDSLCHILFAYLFRDYFERYQVPHGIVGALRDKRLQNAVHAMLDEPQKNWNMKTLAQCCAMSRANFIRVFKQKTGISVGSFLTDLRMNKAENLLKTTNKTISAIALEAGYQSETHFSKIFKSYYGVSPGKYRSF